ncbi:MAG: hypothetical protein ACK4NM_18645, partial [Hydrogenophaga sp.]
MLPLQDGGVWKVDYGEDDLPVALVFRSVRATLLQRIAEEEAADALARGGQLAGAHTASQPRARRVHPLLLERRVRQRARRSALLQELLAGPVALAPTVRARVADALV